MSWAPHLSADFGHRVPERPSILKITLHQVTFSLEISVLNTTGWGLFLILWVLCCAIVAIPETYVFLSFFVVAAAFAFEVSVREVGCDGFQTQESKSWIPEKDREEKVLADAITNDGRQDWICKFCSESNVWTRWRCRRCYSNIPTELREKYTQAISAKTGEWLSGSSSSQRGEEKKSQRSGCGD